MKTELIAWLDTLEPVFPQLSCCSFPIGFHDGTVKPSHDPVIVPGTGVVILQWDTLVLIKEALNGKDQS